MPRSKSKVCANVRFFAALTAGLFAGRAAMGLTWDSKGTSPTAPLDGAGTWDLTHADWSTGTVDQIWPNNSTIATFGDNNGAAGIVNLTTAITASGLVFNPAGSGNYNLAGSSLFLSAGTVQLSNANPIIASTLSGSAGLALSGSGSLTLAGTNFYSGLTNVSGGQLIVASSMAIASSSNLMVSAAGALTFNSSDSVGSTLNNGSLTIAAGQTMLQNSSSLAFQQSAGTLTINGALVLNGGTFNYTGGSIVGTVNMNGSSPHLTLAATVSSGTFLFSGTTAQLESAAIPTGVTVLFQPTTTGSADLIGLGTLTNNGTLTLTSFNGGSMLVEENLVNSGLFTLSAAGMPSLAATLADAFTNNAGATALFNTSSSVQNVINNGSLTIAAGQTMLQNSSSLAFQQSAGTLTINGALVLNGGTFNYTGGSIVGTVNMNGSSGHLTLASNVSSGMFLFSGTTAQLESLAIPSGVTVLFQPATTGSADLIGLGTLTNNGTLTLTSFNGGSMLVEENLVNSGLFTLSAAGTPSLAATLADSFTNNTGATALFNTSSSVQNVINNGSLTIAASQTMLQNSSSLAFQQSAGTLTINGALVLNGGTFNYTGGSIVGTVNMNGSSGHLTLASNVSSGMFLFSGTTAQLESLAIPSGVTVLFQPATTGSADLIGLGTLTNNGTLTLTSFNGGSMLVEENLVNSGLFTLSAAGMPSLAATLADAFTNNAGATALFNTSSSVQNVINNGSLTIAAGQTMLQNSSSLAFQQSAGTLTINGALVLNGGTFNYTGGSIVGTVNMNGSSPHLTLAATVSTGTFLFTGTTAQLESAAIPTGVTVLFQPTTTGSADLIGLGTLTNNGTLTLTSFNGGSMLVEENLMNSGLFTLSASGTPSLAATLADSFTNNTGATALFNTSVNLNGNLLNAGTMNVSSGTLKFGSSSFQFNQTGGTTTVAAGTAISVPAIGQFFISGGTINLASSSSTAGSLGIESLLWPNPSSPMNPATDLAFINTLPYTAPQNPGFVNLNGVQATFNIADPAATLTVSAQLSNGSIVKSGPGTLVLSGNQAISGPLDVNAGTVTIAAGATFPSNPGIVVASGATLNVMASIPNDVITNNGTVNFPVQTTPGIHVVAISGLALTTGQQSTIANPSLHSNRTLLQLGSLTFGGGTGTWQGLFDLTGNDLDIAGASSPSLTNITNQIKEGYNNGTWTGAGGITSSAAAADTTHLTTLGVIQNNQGGTAIYGSGASPKLFDGTSPGASDVLVKYTYYGDTNLDGTVDGTDYSRIDNATLSHGTLTGWFNGDFNYDGVINGSDYTLIDNAFNMQGASLASSLAGPTAEVTAQISQPASVPEPTAVMAVGLAGLLGLRRRRASLPRQIN